MPKTRHLIIGLFFVGLLGSAMAASPTLPADVNPANTDRWTPSSTENEPKAGGSCLEICQRQGDEEGDCEDTCLQQAKMETRGFTQLACR